MYDRYWMYNKIYPFVWEIYTRCCQIIMMDEKRLRKSIAPSYLRTIHRACESLVRNAALVASFGVTNNTILLKSLPIYFYALLQAI